MKGKKLGIIALSAVMVSAGVAGLAACGGGKEVSENIVNGGFEANADESTWVGWTKEGNAFSARSVVESSKYTENGVEKTAVVDKEGKKFFFGIGGGNSSRNTGSLTSDAFKLTGTGKIAFKMGAAKDGDKVYVEFYEKGGKTALAKVTNEDFNEPYVTNHMIRKIVDLSAYVGKTVYIKVTDNDNGRDFGYVNLDDFVVCATDAEVTKYEQERAAQLKKYGEPAFTEDETNTTIDNGGFETGDLTNWKILSGTAFLPTNVVSTAQRYWNDRAVYGHGEYYLDGNNNGQTEEAATGAIRSQKFTLAGDGYISFMMGAGKANCYVAICDGATDEELIKIENEYFSDPALALTLLRRYVDASEYLGKVLYIKVVDNSVNDGFSFLTVDDFRVSLTEQEVKTLQVEQYKAIANETYESATYKDLSALQDYYDNYAYPFPLEVPIFTAFAPNKLTEKSDTVVDLNAMLLDGVAAKFGEEAVTDIAVSKVVYDGNEYTEGFGAFDLSKDGVYTVTYTATHNDMRANATLMLLVHSDVNQVANGGFETGNLVGWTVLTEGWGYSQGQPNGVVNQQTYWNEELPLNQSGNYHLSGWDNGFEEGDTWAIRSSAFTLGGSGWISVKMGGHAAAVKVYKADGTLIGEYRQSRFNDAGFPHVAQGSWADMANYAIDLHAYLGESLYIELCDIAVNGWAQAFFDDVITYYETAPDWENLFDTVLDGHAAGEEAQEIQIGWVLADNYLDQVLIANGAENTVIEAADAFDLTTLISGVTASYGAAGIPVTDIRITKVEKADGTAVTSGFEAFELTAGNYTVTYTAFYAAANKSAEATFTLSVYDEYTVKNGGFETGDLTGWTVLTEGWRETNGKPDGVVNQQTYWNEELPLNQSGNYHLSGWNNGFEEGATWAIRSTTFTLGGSGWISVKMGGHAAAVKVYKADGTQIGEYAQTRFNDDKFPHVGAGGSWADMAVYAIDLSDYLGEQLYIELCDVAVNGWAQAFFDDVVTYYETAPDWENNYDTVKDGHTAEEEAQDVQIYWVLATNRYGA